MTVKSVMVSVRGNMRQVNYELIHDTPASVGSKIELKWGFADPADRELARRLMSSEVRRIESACLADAGLDH